MSAVSTGDEAKHKEFIDNSMSKEFREKVPIERHLGLLKQGHDHQDTVELDKIEKSSDHELVAILKGKAADDFAFGSRPRRKSLTRSAGWGWLQSKTDDWAITRSSSRKTHMRSRRIGFGLIPVCLAVVVGFAVDNHTQSQAGAIVKGELGKKLDEYMASVEAEGFSGALVAAKGSSLLLSKGYGMANRSLKLPFTPDTIVSTGSITKMFTAAAILKLEMQGKLSVGDPIAKFIPNVPADKAAITVHHLLTHTAGFGLQVGSDFDKIGRDEFVKRVMAAPLESPPGTKPNYSNVGFSLAAVIVELASGKPYEHYLYDNLFKPAGMTQTGYIIPRWKPESLAHGYQGSEDWGTLPDKAWGPDGPYWNLRGNGAIHTTIDDMYRWYRALQGDKLLSEAAKKKFFAPHVQEEEGGDLFFGYGCGILKTTRGTKLVTKNGGNRVFYAELRLYVDDGVMFFIVSTNSEFSARRIIPKINEILLGGNQPGEG